jgi:hypothetical protein
VVPFLLLNCSHGSECVWMRSGRKVGDGKKEHKRRCDDLDPDYISPVVSPEVRLALGA